MRVAYMPRTEALSSLKSVAPEDLLQEIMDRGVSVWPDIKLLSRKSECPHCGETKTVGRDFGVRVMGGTVRAQSWCRDCRKNPKRTAKGKKQPPQNEVDMIAALKATLAKAGIKRSDISKLANAMKGART